MKAQFHTLGCKLNYAETSTIERSFINRGFKIVDDKTSCDVFVINTCSVTQRADRECRQIIRQVRRKSPNAFITVIGCYAQLQPEEIASIEGVDLVLGSKEKFNIFSFEENFQKYKNPKIISSPIDEVTNFGPAFTNSTESRTRAYLKIQDGCDFNCSFCTIPLARGGSRSQSIYDIKVQARNLVANGFREIVLTGVNVADFGKKNNTSLLNLLDELSQIENLSRIRISSVEPNLLSDELIKYWLKNEKICKHFHIPLQSGSDNILKLMKRRYTSQKYRELINSIHSQNPDAGIGVDVIVGFPNEDENEFEKTFELLHELPVSYLHVFTYSERTNTPSVFMNGRIEPKIRFANSERLRMLGKKKKHLFHDSQKNMIHEILVESSSDGLSLSGHSDNYLKVKIPFSEGIENSFQKVQINKIDDEICYGELINQEIFELQTK